MAKNNKQLKKSIGQINATGGPRTTDPRMNGKSSMGSGGESYTRANMRPADAFQEMVKTQEGRHKKSYTAP